MTKRLYPKKPNWDKIGSRLKAAIKKLASAPVLVSVLLLPGYKADGIELLSKCYAGVLCAELNLLVGESLQ